MQEERKNNMKIQIIEMDESEMQEFLEYRKEKKNRAATRNRLDEMGQLVLRCIGSRDGEKLEIVDQDYAEELMEMAAMYTEQA